MLVLHWYSGFASQIWRRNKSYTPNGRSNCAFIDSYVNSSHELESFLQQQEKCTSWSRSHSQQESWEVRKTSGKSMTEGCDATLILDASNNKRARL
ncbi:hypothetical protein MUK42_30319 [Musa troglodytarum]|uniref:Uncharacterized protein n=1 Tax=Musa troglodytarum TaxID=320322 RepID=A0A9E7JV80_9LILI|nr:hypothetical protein MUK42_30319 [Musa troglodytarum]URD94905.1 hypothetical protein MUK42_30319 [Musa troglodytarum]